MPGSVHVHKSRLHPNTNPLASVTMEENGCFQDYVIVMHFWREFMRFREKKKHSCAGTWVENCGKFEEAYPEFLERKSD